MAYVRALCLAVLMEFGALVACHAQEPNEGLEWQVKVPITLFYRAIIGHKFDARHYFRDAKFAAQDWSFRRELYVHDDCLTSRSPVYCSEQRIGSKRVAMMRARLKDNPARGNSWLSEAYLANFSTYWIWYRLYDQKYLREISRTMCTPRFGSPRQESQTRRAQCLTSRSDRSSDAQTGSTSEFLVGESIHWRLYACEMASGSKPAQTCASSQFWDSAIRSDRARAHRTFQRILLAGPR